MWDRPLVGVSCGSMYDSAIVSFAPDIFGWNSLTLSLLTGWLKILHVIIFSGSFFKMFHIDYCFGINKYGTNHSASELFDKRSSRMLLKVSHFSCVALLGPVCHPFGNLLKFTSKNGLREFHSKCLHISEQTLILHQALSLSLSLILRYQHTSKQKYTNNTKHA